MAIEGECVEQIYLEHYEREYQFTACFVLNRCLNKNAKDADAMLNSMIDSFHGPSRIH